MKINRMTGRKIKVPEMKAVKKPKRKKKAKKLSTPPKTYVVMILDKSASMWVSKDEARNHFNEQVKSIIESAGGQDVRVSLCIFNDRLEYRYFNDDLSSLKELRSCEYNPNGMTALNDAIGLTIQRMQSTMKDLDEDHVSVLFYIITDGQENRSIKFGGSHGREIIRSMMDKLQATGRWTFTYMGTGHDVEHAALDLYIPVSNTLSFDRSRFTEATVKTKEATNHYFKSRNIGQKSSDQFYDKKI